MKTSESHVFSIYNMLIYTYTTWFRAMCLMYKTMLHIYHQKKNLAKLQTALFNKSWWHAIFIYLSSICYQFKSGRINWVCYVFT